MIKSGFKSRAGYNGARTVYKTRVIIAHVRYLKILVTPVSSVVTSLGWREGIILIMSRFPTLLDGPKWVKIISKGTFVTIICPSGKLTVVPAVFQKKILLPSRWNCNQLGMYLDR